ncbi:L,D-transpeptidase family protein [Puniceicoccus vermicola]|uniref:L,D-TPase catalytic domain-containing protein n=1 Tax=Puniceicoccus vermicola TaxID=388746 RepID=A0A7X1AVH6_9BACT|nr:L,D-transpeptidase family protein [Puniceicoccus vermicola]MBC2600519.1 hypothetical protein [Puniceicoccus vermicola]
MKRLLLLVLVGCLSACLFYHYGRGLWYPYFLKIRGERTVEEVVHEIRQRPGIDFSAERYERLVLLGLKEERKLEVWGLKPSEDPELVAVFPFTGFSGDLGPKLNEGDGQIPEGIYSIEFLHPNSSYHLSLKLNYPNSWDQQKAREDGRTRPGSDIFIHGKSVTIGCIPIGDEGIEELFLMVAETGKENVEVILAPYDFRLREEVPAIEEIDWENELYQSIKLRLEELGVQFT